MQPPLNETSSNVADLISQDFDFVDSLPPLDAFDSILWYVMLFYFGRHYLTIGSALKAYVFGYRS
jgi:hypothetical protein